MSRMCYAIIVGGTLNIIALSYVVVDISKQLNYPLSGLMLQTTLLLAYAYGICVGNWICRKRTDEYRQEIAERCARSQKYCKAVDALFDRMIELEKINQSHYDCDFLREKTFEYITEFGESIKDYRRESK